MEKTAIASTVADQIGYDLPTIAGGSTFDIDTNKIFAIYDRTNDRTYKYIPYEKFVKFVPDPSVNSGESIWWTYWALQAYLFPIPDSVWTMYLDCISLITDWTDAATSNEIPAKYDPVIIDGVSTYVYKFEPKLGNMAVQQQLYEAGIAKMIADNAQMINDDSETQSHRTRGTTGSGRFPLDRDFA